MRRAFFSLLVFPLLITILWTLLAWSQSAARPTSNEKLRVAVVVSDRKGASLPALRSGDFTIEVAGKTKSRDFQIVAPPYEAGIQSPRGTRISEFNGRGLVVVVLDTIHTRWSEDKDVRAGALKYLSGFASRRAPITLFVLGSEGTLNPVHEYQSGSATLAAALVLADAELHNRNPATEASSEIEAETRRLVDFCKGTGKFSASLDKDRGKPGYVLAAMETVARYASGVPGRKSLVWVSSMIPFEVEEKHGRVATLARSEVSADERLLLTSDEIKKLQVLWRESIGSMHQSEIALYPVLIRTDAAIWVQNNVLHAMASLARITGGREYHGTGDPFPQIGDLTGENEGAYEMLVAPEALRECGSDWCALNISVSGEGTHVFAPSGFFPDASLVLTTAGEGAPDPGSGPDAIPFTVTWKPIENVGGNKKCAFVITFGPKAGLMSGGSSELKLDITVSAVSDAVAKQTITFSANSQLAPAMIEQINLKGFALSNAIELQPGDYELSFVVRDKLSGRSGLLKVPLKVS